MQLGRRLFEEVAVHQLIEDQPLHRHVGAQHQLDAGVALAPLGGTNGGDGLTQDAGGDPGVAHRSVEDLAVNPPLRSRHPLHIGERLAAVVVHPGHRQRVVLSADRLIQRLRGAQLHRPTLIIGDTRAVDDPRGFRADAPKPNMTAERDAIEHSRDRIAWVNDVSAEDRLGLDAKDVAVGAEGRLAVVAIGPGPLFLSVAQQHHLQRSPIAGVGGDEPFVLAIRLFDAGEQRPLDPLLLAGLDDDPNRGLAGHMASHIEGMGAGGSAGDLPGERLVEPHDGFQVRALSGGGVDQIQQGGPIFAQDVPRIGPERLLDFDGGRHGDRILQFGHSSMHIQSCFQKQF